MPAAPPFSSEQLKVLPAMFSQSCKHLTVIKPRNFIFPKTHAGGDRKSKWGRMRRGYRLSDSKFEPSSHFNANCRPGRPLLVWSIWTARSAMHRRFVNQRSRFGEAPILRRLTPCTISVKPFLMGGDDAWGIVEWHSHMFLPLIG